MSENRTDPDLSGKLKSSVDVGLERIAAMRGWAVNSTVLESARHSGLTTDPRDPRHTETDPNVHADAHYRSKSAPGHLLKEIMYSNFAVSRNLYARIGV